MEPQDKTLLTWLMIGAILVVGFAYWVKCELSNRDSIELQPIISAPDSSSTTPVE